MTGFFGVYMGLWGSACLIAVALMIRNRSDLDLLQRSYWTGLFQPWKLTTFLIAAIGLVTIAPYTGDPTWDHFDAAFMSVLTYATAPWAVATCYLTVRGERNLLCGYIAGCIWMFSASWSYDLYLVVRDGHYPITWLSNIFASSVLYICAGLFWNLVYVEGRGAIFGFMDPDWPALVSTGKSNRLIWYGLPFVLLVSAMIIPFLF